MTKLVFYLIGAFLALQNVDAAKVTLYDKYNFRGNKLELEVTGTTCEDLPSSWVGHVTSASTRARCAQLYEGQGCTGRFICTAAGKAHKRLDWMSFDNKTASVRLCTRAEEAYCTYPGDEVEEESTTLQQQSQTTEAPKPAPVHQTTEGSSFHSSQAPVYQTSEQPGHHTSGNPGYHTSEQPGHYTSEQPGHHTSGNPGHYTSEQPIHYTSEQPGHHTSGNPGHYTSEQPIYYTSDQPDHQTSGNPGYYTSEEPGHYTSEQPSYHSTDSAEYYSSQGPVFQTSENPIYHSSQTPIYQTTTQPGGSGNGCKWSNFDATAYRQYWLWYASNVMACVQQYIGQIRVPVPVMTV